MFTIHFNMKKTEYSDTDKSGIKAEPWVKKKVVRGSGVFTLSKQGLASQFSSRSD